MDYSLYMGLVEAPTVAQKVFKAPTFVEELCSTELFREIFYAIAKTGAIREYGVIVTAFKDYAELKTQKRGTIGGKMTEDIYHYYEGVNIGKANETTYTQQALLEARSTCNKLLDSGYMKTLPDPRAVYNTDAQGRIKPMLANPYNADKIVFPCLAQPKYDGVRCTISEDSTGVNVISRKGKPYKVPHIVEWANANKHLLPLDGELYNHREISFQDITSAVKKISELTPKINYVVYDRPVEGVSNFLRWNKLCADFKDAEFPIELSGYTICKNHKELDLYLKLCIKNGYEGIIIRNFEGVYEFGFRSADLIKYKLFDEDEFLIAEVFEANGRDAGTAVFCLYLPGHEGEVPTLDNTFRAKPQGTRELRKEYFDSRESLIGKYCTIQYQGLSDARVPRFPSAKSIRDYE